MRLLGLYLRSRRVPAALAAAMGSIVAVWLLGLTTADPGARLFLTALAAVGGTAAMASGLAGADPELERTAAVAWPPRRAAHVMAGAVAVAGGLAATAVTGEPLAHAGLIVRDVAGLTGLVALGAVALGAGRAWLPATAWTVLCVVSGPLGGAWHKEALTWVVQPAGTASATGTAALLGVAGTLGYALRGSRR